MMARSPGEPVVVKVVLENTSSAPIPVGQGGLFAPTVYLSLAMSGATDLSLPDLTPVRLPCPKYLKPGAKVDVTVRVDVGAAGEALALEPLGEIKLVVSGLLDPLDDHRRLVSAVPTVELKPVTIIRKPLFDTAGKAVAAQYALAYIVRDLQKGTLARQLRAARQTGSLLGRTMLVENGKVRAVFPDVVTRPVLLAMMRAFLQSPTPAVRAEMLSALRNVQLDALGISLLGAIVSDPDPIVRMRLVELLAAKRTPGYRTWRRHFARDRDPLVRDMAEAVRAE